MDPSKWEELGHLDAEMQKVVQESPIKSLGSLGSAEGCREYMNGAVFAAAAMLPPPDFTGVKQSDILIPVRDGTNVRAILSQPETPQFEGPLFIWYHGGGWVAGMAEFHIGQGAALAQNGCVSVAVDYRHAPEFPFPTAVNDAWDTFKWLHGHAKELGADPSKGLFICGASAGANLSTVLAHLARDEAISPPITGVFVISPPVIHPTAVPEEYKSLYKAHEQCKDAPLLDRKAMDFFYECYKPDPTSHLFSSLLWPTGHKDLPPHYISVAGVDPLRDDGLIYEKVLRESGVKTKLDVYPGVFHTWMGFRPQHSLTAKSLQDAQAGLMWLLTGAP